MNILNVRKWKMLLLGILLYFCITASAQESIYGNFPYYQGFLSTTKPQECTKPIPVQPHGTPPENVAEFTTEGLKLTPAVIGQFGAIFINDKRFQSHNGIKIEFEYMFYGGTTYDGSYGDGMTVFFFNADTIPNIGAPGAGLGYTYRRGIFNNVYKTQGIAGAYLGIGFDSFGNFKTKRWELSSRRNGIDVNLSGMSNARDQITLRGAKGVPYIYNGRVVPGMGDGYTGYPTLITVSTNGPEKIVLQNNGSYAQTSFSHTYFPLSGGEYKNTGSPNYRKAFIEIFPHPNGGFYVTVKIRHGQTTTSIIDDYHYRQSFTYIENAMPFSLTDGDNSVAESSGPDRALTLNATIPEFLRVGFAASTGNATNIHLIKHLQITLPSAAEAYPDSAVTTSNIPALISPLINDIAYKGTIAKNQVGDPGYIDPVSFRFILADGSVAPNDYTTAEGRWIYNPTTQKITFTPNLSFTGIATIYYDIKGKEGQPYIDEAYRSIPTTVTVRVESAPVTTNVLMNRMVSPVIK